MGHPAGIGPEVILKALSDRTIARKASFLIIGDGRSLRMQMRRFGIHLPLATVTRDTISRYSVAKSAISLLDLDNVPAGTFLFGSDAPGFGKSSVEYIYEAVRLLKKGVGDALVTAPIHKASAQRAGFKFAGHTECLAGLTRTKEYAMMLAGGRLKVTVVTRHIPLKDVASSITVRKITSALLLTCDAVRRLFKIKKPRIGVAGLNPHAGEGGKMGSEEKMIQKAIRSVRDGAICIEGPIPPDTLFYHAYQNRYDAVVAMYHDQGLIPLKMLYFEKGVNITLGLPFVRTSPDHGTALGIAGKNTANPGSMKEAIRLACRLSGS